MKKILIILITLGILGSGGYALMRYYKYYKEPAPEAVDFREVSNNQNQSETTENPPSTESNDSPSEDKNENSEDQDQKKETETPLPPSLNLKMAFYSQAPFGNWDYPWQEACEEASVLLVANAYFNREWSKEDFNKEILKLVEWEKEHFGDYKHTDMDQTMEILEDYLKLDAVIHEDPSFEDIQRILAKGHFVVMPFAGKMLHNPNFRNGGPMYHVLVVKGYKEGEKIVTHDVGTRNGADYVYSWKTAEEALHDYAEPITKGAKRIIEVLPPVTDSTSTAKIPQS